MSPRCRYATAARRNEVVVKFKPPDDVPFADEPGLVVGRNHDADGVVIVHVLLGGATDRSRFVMLGLVDRAHPVTR